MRRRVRGKKRKKKNFFRFFQTPSPCEANIRQKFSDTKKMSGYDRRKYIAKLMYIFLLGYEVDFGHLEALKLLADIKVVCCFMVKYFVC